MEWVSSLTGKTGLTYEEAVEAESSSMEFLDSLPKALYKAIVYMIYKFSDRTRIDDLVNDIFVVLKDRYFVDEGRIVQLF